MEKATNTTLSSIVGTSSNIVLESLATSVFEAEVTITSEEKRGSGALEAGDTIDDDDIEAEETFIDQCSNLLADLLPEEIKLQSVEGIWSQMSTIRNSVKLYATKMRAAAKDVQKVSEIKPAYTLVLITLDLSIYH